MSGFVEWLLGLEGHEAPAGSSVTFELPGIPAGDGAWLAAALLAASLALIVILYRREADLSAPKRLLLGGLRVAALLAVVLMLLDPQLYTEIQLERRARTFLLFDTSASMAERDRLDGSERYEMEDATGLELYQPKSRVRMCRGAVEETDLVARLDERNDVRLLTFDRELRALAELDTLEEPSPSADATRIGDALRGVLRVGAEDPIAAVVLFSDGRPTGGEKWDSVAREYAARAIPVHTAIVGKARVHKNVAIQKLVAPDLAPTGFPFRIDARIGATGLRRRTIQAVLTRHRVGDRRAETVATEVLRPEHGELDESLTFYDTLEERGTYLYSIAVKVDPEETSRRDNRRTVRVVCAEQTSRTLLVAGSPTFEYRFVRNLLLRDQGVQASIWLASAPDDYPQDGDVVLDSLPSSERELRAYDAIVLLDPTLDILTDEFTASLRKLVVERGTGLVYVAGENLSAPGRVEDLALLLPVDLESSGGGWSAQSLYTRAWRPLLTLQGAEHPLCQLDPDAVENARLWSRLQPFYFYSEARTPKPAARVLAAGPDGTAFLAVHRAGAGYSVFIGADELHRWRAGRPADLHERFWSGMVRFLALGKKLAGQRDATIYVGRDRCDVGEEIAVEATLLDSEKRPVTRPHLEVAVEFERLGLKLGAPAGAAESPAEDVGQSSPPQLRLDPVDGRPGWYRGTMRSTAAGRYTLRAEGAEASFEAVRLTTELEDPSPDVYTLRGIAESTGGKLISLGEVESLPDLIRSRTTTETVGRSRARLWDSPLVLALFCGALVLEWILRKLWRLH